MNALDELLKKVNKNGPVPDHRPDLGPVTRRVNLLRGATISARNAAQTHCPKGHPYDGANTYVYTQPSGVVVRLCRQCRRLRNRTASKRRRIANQPL